MYWVRPAFMCFFAQSSPSLTQHSKDRTPEEIGDLTGRRSHRSVIGIAKLTKSWGCKFQKGERHSSGRPWFYIQTSNKFGICTCMGWDSK
jgi:hypothetical protein